MRRALGDRRHRHHLGLPRLQPRGGAAAPGRRQLHLHAREPDPGRQDAGRGRPGRRSGPTRSRASRGSSPRPAPTSAATRSRSSASTRSTSRCASSRLAGARARGRSRSRAWMPFLLDWIFNGDCTGHVQSLILGAVLFIAAVQLFALGVIGDLLAGQRVMTQRVFERVRRVELRSASSLALRARHPGVDRGDREDRRVSAPALNTRAWSAEAGELQRRAGRAGELRPLGLVPLDRRRRSTGLITYIYFAIASHVLSKPDYGEITVLWSAVFITVSTLYRPIEQLLSRHICRARARGPADRRAAAGRGDDPARARGCLRGPRAALRGPLAGRPARGQRDPLLDLRRARSLSYARQLLRPRLPRRAPPLRPLRRADPRPSRCPATLFARRWSRSASPTASRRSRSASSPPPASA